MSNPKYGMRKDWKLIDMITLAKNQQKVAYFLSGSIVRKGMIYMGYRPVCVAGDPLDYFLKENEENSRMRIADVIVRQNKSATELFSRLIRFATASPWSHSAIIYLLPFSYSKVYKTPLSGQLFLLHCGLPWHGNL
jgi:hypothetical protein